MSPGSTVGMFCCHMPLVLSLDAQGLLLSTSRRANQGARGSGLRFVRQGLSGLGSTVGAAGNGARGTNRIGGGGGAARTSG